MNKEEKMPTYGELYAENFRLEHNYRVVSEREAKLQNNWNELKKWLEEEIKDYRKREWFPVANNLKEVLDKMQELEGNNENTFKQ